MNARLLKIECITNLHVGSGDVNFNIVDKEVERDPVTNYPTINSSGVKGAFREYFESNNLDKIESNKDKIEDIFGSENKSGKVKFLAADLIAIPVRCSGGESPYKLVYSENMRNRHNTYCEFSKSIDKCNIEDIKAPQFQYLEGKKIEIKKKTNLNKIYDIKNLVLLSEKDFEELVVLPIMARNHLENGISQNLFYEEVVPHHSIFCIPVLSDDKETLNNFIKTVDDKVVQFGGNASIGYGLCKVSVLRGANNE